MSTEREKTPDRTTPRRITQSERPVFPCWLWRNFTDGSASWGRYKKAPDFALPNVTHWLPDSPTAPTCVPEDLPATANDTLLGIPEIDKISGSAPTTVSAREIVFFINSDVEGLGNHANSLESALEWFKNYLENMEDGDKDDVIFSRRDMTRAEIDVLPEQ